MTVGLAEDDDGHLAAADTVLVSLVHESSVAVIGPGLGRSPRILPVLRAVLTQTPTPLVLDADALNALAHSPQDLGRPAGPVVITPHPGEFSRLLQSVDIAGVQADRENLAATFAAAHGIVVVLKGQGTIVTDGRRLAVNATGNPGMATGGTGDVLGGLIAALLGQGLEAFAAARLGVHLHGLAGDLARDDLGETSLIATDVIDYLPQAFRAHARAATTA
jgi:NAD(P)H-hydrate epimerase